MLTLLPSDAGQWWHVRPEPCCSGLHAVTPVPLLLLLWLLHTSWSSLSFCCSPSARHVSGRVHPDLSTSDYRPALNASSLQTSQYGAGGQPALGSWVRKASGCPGQTHFHGELIVMTCLCVCLCVCVCELTCIYKSFC